MNIHSMKPKPSGITLKEYMFGYSLKNKISSKSKDR
jgi:hypothetical protein